jgi:hypothetical protein
MAMVFHFAPKVRTAVEGCKRTQAGLIVVVKDSLSYCRKPSQLLFGTPTESLGR